MYNLYLSVKLQESRGRYEEIIDSIANILTTLSAFQSYGEAPSGPSG